VAEPKRESFVSRALNAPLQRIRKPFLTQRALD